MKPRVRDARTNRSQTEPFYLRDRDFDYEPNEEQGLCIDAVDSKGRLLGWRWYRHEIESYLLEPAIVAATGICSLDQFRQFLGEAQAALAAYQAARWAIGMCRRELPPNYDLQTKWAEKPEFVLPDNEGLTEEGARIWLEGHVGAFREHVVAAIGHDTVAAHFAKRLALFRNAQFTSDPIAVLVWYSGKDLMAYVAHRLDCSPGDVRNRMRDWVRAHPDEAEASWPEIVELREALRREEARR